MINFESDINSNSNSNDSWNDTVMLSLIGIVSAVPTMMDIEILIKTISKLISEDVIEI